MNSRLCTATHRDVRGMVAEGTFREDLFYRLRVVELLVPPLRERPQDILLLAVHFVQAAARRFGISTPIMAEGERKRLLAHSWPGNVRELRNVVEEALALNPQGPLRFRLHEHGDASAGVFSDAQATGTMPYDSTISLSASGEWPTLDDVQAKYLRDLLRACHGRVGGPLGAAAKAGVKANTLRFRLDKLGIPYGRKGD